MKAKAVNLSKEQEARYHKNLLKQAEGVFRSSKGHARNPDGSWSKPVLPETVVERINRLLAKDGWL